MQKGLSRFLWHPMLAIIALSTCAVSCTPQTQTTQRPVWDTFAVRHMYASDSLIHSPGFAAVTATDYEHPRAYGMAGLEAVLRLDKVQHWIITGEPDPNYELWVHPSKLMGVLAQGMVFLAQNTGDPEISDQAMAVAVASTKFLLSLREPPDAPLANWPPSYWDGVDGGDHPTYMSQIMTPYPAEAAMALLDLYDATGDTDWWDPAMQIAETYAKLQRSDGTWPLLVRRDNGEGVRDFPLVPVTVINFFDRLSNQYGVTDYRELRKRAFNWIWTNPVETYAWDAQYEDTRPRQRYKNLSHREAAGFARLLFDTTTDPDTLRVAAELLSFVEDQFTVWTHEDEVTRRDWFKTGSKWNGSIDDDPQNGKDWFLPATLEQYAFYTPIAGTTSNAIHAFCAAFFATGDVRYRSKARALTRSIVEAQTFHGGGEIPTHLRKTLPEENWLNNSVYAAQTLVDARCL